MADEAWENDGNEETKVEVKAESEGVTTEANETENVSEKLRPARMSLGGEESGNQMDYSDTFRSLSAGDVVGGVVVHIDKEGVLVDVGTKSEGIIRPGELASGPVQAVEDVVSVGDKIDVYVVQPEGEDGNLILSKKRADFENAWQKLQEAHEQGITLNAMVTDRVKGGLVVDLGIRGFIPGSHVGSGKVQNLDRYVGQSLPLKVIEVDRERRKVVLSHRLAIEQERSEQRISTVSSLTEGQVREGVVRRVTDYGAFIDLGGIDGLLHISEMSWTRIKHPSEVVKVGQKIQVVVLRLNIEAGRVSLGIRQILPDPWAEISGKYRVGEVIKGNVSRLVPFGAFVQLDQGIEGIIPNAELSSRRVNRPEDVISVGEFVEAKIIDLRPNERRMTLSIRQMHEEKDLKEYEDRQSSRSDGRMTLGELIGDKLQELTGVGISETEEKIEESTIETKPIEATEDAVTEITDSVETVDTSLGDAFSEESKKETVKKKPEKSAEVKPKKKTRKKSPDAKKK